MSSGSTRIRTSTWPAFDAGKFAAHRFIALAADGRLAGWIACSAVSELCVYTGAVEHSVCLYRTSGDRASDGCSWSASSQIPMPRASGPYSRACSLRTRASLALNERAGFRVVGTRERIGRHHGRWRDVVLLEHRRPLVN